MGSIVYYEMHATMEDAIKREKQLKKWNRAWKLRLIEEMNPEWKDLFDEFWGRNRRRACGCCSYQILSAPERKSDLDPRLRGDDERTEKTS